MAERKRKVRRTAVIADDSSEEESELINTTTDNDDQHTIDSDPQASVVEEEEADPYDDASIGAAVERVEPEDGDEEEEPDIHEEQKLNGNEGNEYEQQHEQEHEQEQDLEDREEHEQEQLQQEQKCEPGREEEHEDEDLDLAEEFEQLVHDADEEASPKRRKKQVSEKVKRRRAKAAELRAYEATRRRIRRVSSGIRTAPKHHGLLSEASKKRLRQAEAEASGKRPHVAAGPEDAIADNAPPEKQYTFTKQSAEDYLDGLYGLDVRTMIVVITNNPSRWNAVLAVEDEAVDNLSPKDMSVHFLLCIGLLLRPGVSDTVMRERLRTWVRSFFGSKLLCCPTRLPRLLLALPSMVREWVDAQHQAQEEVDTQADQEVDKANAKKLKKQLDHIKKTYKSRDRKKYARKKQKALDESAQALKTLQRQRRHRDRDRREKPPKHQAVEVLYLFFTLLLDFAEPYIDAHSAFIIDLFVNSFWSSKQWVGEDTMNRLTRLSQRMTNALENDAYTAIDIAELPTLGKSGVDLSPKGVVKIKVESSHSSFDNHNLVLKQFPPGEALNVALHELLFRLPKNIAKGVYDNIQHYLDTHFNLLQADCFAALICDLQQFQAMTELPWRHPDEAKELDRLGNKPIFDAALQKYFCNIYTDIEVRGVGLLSIGAPLTFSLSFQLYNPNQAPLVSGIAPAVAPVDWNQCKKLDQGALVCLSFDMFRTVFWATIELRNPLMLANGLVMVAFIANDGPRFVKTVSARGACRGLLMAECSTFFKAYAPVLRSLMLVKYRGVPFERELIQARCSNHPAHYLTTLPPEEVLRTRKEVLGALTLDETQQGAVNMALSNRLALIQGPPGTGKTFTGLKITEMVYRLKVMAQDIAAKASKLELIEDELGKMAQAKDSGIEQPAWLANMLRAKWHQACHLKDHAKTMAVGPILILTYKNHALDQFLSGCIRFTDNIVRVGSRSKNELMQAKNLKLLTKKLPRSKAHMRGRFHAVNRMVAAKRELVTIIFLLNQLVSGSVSSLSAELHAYLVKHAFEQKASRTHQDLLAIKCPDEELRDASLEVLLRTWLPPAERTVGRKGTCPLKMLDLRLANVDLDRGQVPPASVLRGLGMGTVKARRVVREWHEQEQEAAAAGAGQAGKRKMVDRSEATEEGKESFGSANIVHSCPLRFKHVRPDDRSIARIQREPNLWCLTIEARTLLARDWLLSLLQDRRSELTMEHQRATHDFNQLREDMYLSILRNADIVGMTTTGAAMHPELLNALCPSVVIVEEAAEILEAQLIPCLHPKTQHLILIGDHKQLQPSIECYTLERTKDLHISLFERLINNGFPVQTLGFQRRMHPAISHTIGSIYPNLRNHASLQTRVFQLMTEDKDEEEAAADAKLKSGGGFCSKVTDRQPVPGGMDPNVVCEIPGFRRNLVFWTHRHSETTSASGFSVANPHEVSMIAFLARCLLLQGIPAERITVLTTYRGQLSLLRKAMSALRDDVEIRDELRRGRKTTIQKDPIESLTVDMYQGDENDIVLLSLVRSNEDEIIGFLSRPNRYCVALSRARHALYVVGNLRMLASKNNYWAGLVDEATATGALTENMPLVCPLHPDHTLSIHSNQSLHGYADMFLWNKGGSASHTHSSKKCEQVVAQARKLDRERTEYYKENKGHLLL